MKIEEGNKLKNYLVLLANAIREKNKSHNLIIGNEFEDNILKILDVYSSVGIIYSFEKEPLGINFQYGKIHKEGFNGYSVLNKTEDLIINDIQYPEYIIQSSGVLINLEIKEE